MLFRSIAPAMAAAKISTGVACAKKNAVTKVGTDKYTCTTNPLSTSTKLIWVWQGCLDTNKAYLSTKTKYDAILKQVAGASTTLTATIQNSINNMILWKPTKNYSKDDVVYVTGKTYYVALMPSTNKDPKEPSANLGSYWSINKPGVDANVGTSPDANQVIEWKQQDITDWMASVAKLTTDLNKLQGIKNPDAKTTALIKQIQSLINTYNIGVKNANTNIKNLKANLLLQTNQQTNETTVKSIKSDVEQAKTIRDQSCAKGL